MSRRRDESDYEGRIKLMKNLWRVIILAFCSCLVTIILAMMAHAVPLVVIKIFLYALILVSGVYSIITFVTAGITIYFKTTSLDEEAFREAVGELWEAIKDA